MSLRLRLTGLVLLMYLVGAVLLLTRTELVSSLFLLLLFSVVVYLALGYWLRPLALMADSLAEMVRGDYGRRVPDMTLPELREVAERINELAAVLGASRSENERLAQQALTIQEQDRRRLAQELHDSLGQAVSAIKATAVSIAMRTDKSDPAVAESALSIERISDTAYSSVRDMMAELRPQVLDELGLVLALQQMVDDWNIFHEDTFCRLKVDGDFSDLAEPQQINLYRIVQETLTNVAKHAQAEQVTITLSGQEVVTLTIADDGVGFTPQRVRTGMGMSGLRDRVLLLRGTLQISSNEGKGTTIQVEVPRKFQLRRRRDDK